MIAASKHHGLGNDFIVALVDHVPPGAPELARRWCHRTTGVGADGLIFGTRSGDHDLVMTLFNADGSLAEISGNGIRCLAQAEARRRGVDTVTLEVETGAGLRRLVVTPGGDANELQVRVSMGAVTDGPGIPENFAAPKPIAVVQSATAAVGNPHLVLQVEDPSVVDLGKHGPAIEQHWMPDGINVHFLTVAGPDTINLLHWERGAGVTAACGSGATVSATIANQLGLVGNTVQVNMPGGSAQVDVGPEATLTGPAVHIADLTLSVDANG